MTTLKANICVMCIHMRGFAPGENITCEAFPAGIPNKYLSGDQDHITPDPNDNGIQFQPKSAFRGIIDVPAS